VVQFPWMFKGKNEKAGARGKKEIEPEEREIG
jgi:hypothetical protein